MLRYWIRKTTSLPVKQKSFTSFMWMNVCVLILNRSFKFLDHVLFYPAWEKVGWSLKSLRNIIWVPRMSVHNFMVIHPIVVEIFQPGLKWCWQTDRHFHPQSQLLAWLNKCKWFPKTDGASVLTKLTGVNTAFVRDYLQLRINAHFTHLWVSTAAG